MSNLFISASTEKFNSGVIEVESPSEIISVELVINGITTYSLNLPAGMESKQIEFNAATKEKI